LFLCRLIDSSTSASVASRMALYKFDYYYYYHYKRIQRARRQTVKHQGWCACVQAQRLSATLEPIPSKITLLQPE